MNVIYLDLVPAYVPFIVQAIDPDGVVSDPTVDNLIIYEESGANAVFDATEITGSPFDPAKVNAKTGLWGVLVAKTAFTAGKWYIALWEMTVDGITTAKVERYFATNGGTFAHEGNVRKTFTLAAVEDAVRKVGIGRIDNIKIEVKADTATDWSAPVATKYLYFWYDNVGDTNPTKVGEDG